jgi:hypothetical protein
VYCSSGSRPNNNDLRVPLAHDPRQTFLAQQVLVAQTSPGRQSKLEVQSGRGAQGILGPQNPTASESSKQKQSEPQLLRLPHTEPSQLGAEHWPFWQIPEGHYSGVSIYAWDDLAYKPDKKGTYQVATCTTIARITKDILTRTTVAAKCSGGACWGRSSNGSYYVRGTNARAGARVADRAGAGSCVCWDISWSYNFHSLPTIVI